MSQKSRNRMTAVVATVAALLLGAWPVSIVLRGRVKLIDQNEALRPGLGTRGAFANSGSKDVGPDPENLMKRRS
jgi:hypothetical protein